MQPPRVPYTTRWRYRARGLALATVASVAAVGLAFPGIANAETPVLGSIKASSEYSGQETIEAQIDPELYETVWTVSLNCPDQPRCQSTEGRLPADDESHTVTVVVTGLETETHYQYTVEASSLAGVTSFSGEFESIPPGAAPKGVKDEEVYVPPELPWANQSGDEAAERTVEEQREKEHEEQKAKEVAGRAAEETEVLKRREAEAANQDAAHQEAVQPKMNPACVVPKLKDDTLAVARRALNAAHCRLGLVHRPARQHGTLCVRRQSVRAGKRLADEARVALWIEAGSDTQ
jgi:hypothetical protein